MAFWILGTVALPVLIRFDIGEDGRASLLRLREMGIDIVNVDQHPIDDVGHCGPLLRRLTVLTMVPRSLVVRCRRRQHDEAVASLHLAMAEAAVLVEHSRALLEAET